MTDAANAPTLPALLRRQAAERPTRTAIISGDRRMSYAELDAGASRVANALIADGVAPGARVALLARDTDASYQVLFGCARAGAVALSVNWRLAAREIAYIIQDATAEIVFVGRDLAAQLAQVRAELPGVRRIVVVSGGPAGDGIDWPTLDQWLAGHGDRDPAVPCSPDDVVFQLYTSGTTGSPKGAQLTHRSLFALLDALARHGDDWIAWSARDVLLLPLPSFHIAGVWWVVRSIAAGATCIVMEAFVGWQVLDHIARHRVTKLAAVPAMLAVLLAEPGCRTTDFSSLTHVIYGASPVAQVLLEQTLATLRCAMVQIYGMTETGNAAVSLRPEDHTLPGNPRMRSAGRALPGVAIKIIDPQGRALPPRQVGEICIHSPANMIGYWHLAQATAETLRDGWIHSGDAGYLDEDGYLFIQDRVKDMIISAGENIYPAEIENALHEHPAIAEVAVIGVPDPRWGEAVKAIVVLRAGHAATADDLLGFARGRIAGFKVPKSVDFVAALPRTPSGKIKKTELRAPYWKGRERQVN